MMPAYSAMVGERLRNIRLQKGMSLHDVEVRSSKEFKASVLGAYERGERSISVPRLQNLARFYGVPVDHLLPRAPGDADVSDGRTSQEKLRIDLRKLDEIDIPEKPVIQRYLNHVQMKRGDFNGKVLTIRANDLDAIASVLDLTVETFTAKLDELGLKGSV